MQISFDGQVLAADSETRTIKGLVVPFSKVGNTSAGPVQFEFGAFGDIDASAIVLNMEHDRTRPVGRGIAGSEEITPNGVSMAFKIAPTNAGNDALVEASEGLRPSFSIEAEVDKYNIQKGVMIVSAAKLTGVAHVTKPAFKDANISQVAATEADETPETTEAEIAAEEQPQEIQVEENTAPVADEVTASAVVQAAAPVAYAKPRIEGMDSRSYLSHSIKAAMGDQESKQLILAADDSTSTNTGLTLPQHRAQFVTNTFGNRPAIDAIGVGALPTDGLSYTVPHLTAAPTVATTSEGGAPSETGMTSDYITCTIVKKSGLNRISFELLERSNPSFEALLLSEMQKAYARNTDAYVIAQLTAGGTQATATAGTYDGLDSFISTEGPAAYVATGGDYASQLIASADWWKTLLAEQDSTGRPMFPDLGAMNVPGRVGSQDAMGIVKGTEFRVDSNIATSGLIDESAFLVSPAAVLIEESPTTQLRVNVLSSGEVEIGIHGYIAATVLKAGGVRRFNLT